MMKSGDKWLFLEATQLYLWFIFPILLQVQLNQMKRGKS